VSECGNLALLADYNRWMNGQLYALAAPLGEVALREDRGAFFGSLFGTFSHILVADTIWLKRFSRHPGCGAGWRRWPMCPGRKPWTKRPVRVLWPCAARGNGSTP